MSKENVIYLQVTAAQNRTQCSKTDTIAICSTLIIKTIIFWHGFCMVR